MTWLISLFASPERADAIVGDLEEECREHAKHRGVQSARRWYVRQAIAAIPYLITGQLRATPFAIAGLGFLALLLFNGIMRGADWSARMLVSHYSVYARVPASIFWSVTMALEIYGTPLVAGWITGKIARDRAITSIIAMSVVVNAWTIAAMTLRWPPEMQGVSLQDVLPRVLLRATTATLLMMAGAAVARIRAREGVALG